MMLKELAKLQMRLITELRQAGDDDSLDLAEDSMLNKYDALMSVVKQRNGNGDEPQIKLWYGKGNRQYYGFGALKPIVYVKD